MKPYRAMLFISAVLHTFPGLSAMADGRDAEGNSTLFRLEKRSGQ
jgi:hypothetical protein